MLAAVVAAGCGGRTTASAPALRELRVSAAAVNDPPKKAAFSGVPNVRIKITSPGGASIGSLLMFLGELHHEAICKIRVVTNCSDVTNWGWLDDILGHVPSA